jgi:hypothetical protein
MCLRFADLFATLLARAILVFGTYANFCLLIWRITILRERIYL